MTILAFIFWVVIALFASGIVTHRKDTQPKNKVHFYVARDKNGDDYIIKSAIIDSKHISKKRIKKKMKIMNVNYMNG